MCQMDKLDIKHYQSDVSLTVDDNTTAKVRVWYDYTVIGNDHIAIAINNTDPNDAHYFTPQTMAEDGLDQTAYIRALGWAYPGAGADDDRLKPTPE